MSEHNVVVETQEILKRILDLSDDGCSWDFEILTFATEYAEMFRKLRPDADDKTLHRFMFVAGVEFARVAARHAFVHDGRRFRESKQTVSDKQISDATVECNGNKTAAAKRLGITRQALYKRLKTMNK